MKVNSKQNRSTLTTLQKKSTLTTLLTSLQKKSTLITFLFTFLFLGCFFSNASFATFYCPRTYDGICPLVGVDFKWLRIAAKRDWRPEYPALYPAGNIYAGFRFHENFGMEFGYEQTKKKRRRPVHGVGARFFEFPIENFVYKRSIKFQTWHTDLNYYIALLHCFDFTASIGVGLIRPDMRTRAIVGPFTSLEESILLGVLGSRAIFRARVGMQYHYNDYIGLRALLGFDNTAHIAYKNHPLREFTRRNIPFKPFRDCPSASLGVFFKLY